MARASTSLGQSELESMSDSELRELMRLAKETLSRRITERIAEFRMLAREAGFEITLTKLGEGRERGKTRRSVATPDTDNRREVAAKYRNPNSPAEVWSGRGRKPRWLEDQLAKGATVEDFLISPAATKEASA